jgi:hypothetical protein
MALKKFTNNQMKNLRKWLLESENGKATSKYFLLNRAFRYSRDKNVVQSAMTLIAERPILRFYNIIQYKFLKVIPERSIPQLRE